MLMNGSRQTGFSLMELLVALILTSLLATTVGQFQTFSLQIQLLIQQEALAARTAEDLALQLNSNISPPDSLPIYPENHHCPPSNPQASFDFSLFCQAKHRLPGMQAKQQGKELLLTWQSPMGKRAIRRPTK